MALTNKEKMARRRAKIAADPQKREEYLKAERERKKKQRKDFKKLMSAQEVKRLNAKESARVLAIYKKKKEEKSKLSAKDKANPTIDSPKKAYKSKQSLGKAVTKASNNLPSSPKKRIAVVKALAKKCGLELSPNVNQVKESKSSLDEKSRVAVEEFYISDDISWQAPGKKDRMILREVSGGKTLKKTIQLRYMLMSIKEAFAQFKEAHPQMKIGKSKFAELRPKNIQLFDKIPHNVCVCSYHENMRLLLLALKSATNLSTEFSTFINQIVCDPTSETCMSLQCNKCNEKIACFKPNSAIENEPIKYIQWQKSEKLEKVEILSTVKETFDVLKSQLKYFLIHTFIKRNQSTVFEDLKSNVNRKNVLIQVDFSQNAALLHQNEVQSAHWVHAQATIFTAYAWIDKNVSLSIVIVSDTLDHTKTTVYKFVDYIFSLLKQKFNEIEVINVFSDGPSSQFKQRYLFSNLFLFEQSHKMEVIWNFFATSHGKGVVDGIGGTVKRTVWRHIKAEKILVTTAEQFAEVAKSLNPNVHIKYISENEIKKSTQSLHAHWQAVLPIPNIQSVHYVKTLGSKQVQISEISQNLQPSKKFTNAIIFSSPESSDDEFEIDEPPAVHKININDWVVVKYDSNLYPGYVTKVKEKDIEVSVMHQSEGNFKWPQKEDKLFYKLDDVIKIIEPPIPAGHRGQFKFKEAF